MDIKKDNKFSIILRQTRQICQLNQVELSKLSGISVRTISRIENGKDPNLHTYRTLLTTLQEYANKHQISNLISKDISNIIIKINI